MNFALPAVFLSLATAASSVDARGRDRIQVPETAYDVSCLQSKGYVARLENVPVCIHTTQKSIDFVLAYPVDPDALGVASRTSMQKIVQESGFGGSPEFIAEDGKVVVRYPKASSSQIKIPSDSKVPETQLGLSQDLSTPIPQSEVGADLVIPGAKDTHSPLPIGDMILARTPGSGPFIKQMEFRGETGRLLGGSLILVSGIVAYTSYLVRRKKQVKSDQETGEKDGFSNIGDVGSVVQESQGTLGVIQAPEKTRPQVPISLEEEIFTAELQSYFGKLATDMDNRGAHSKERRTQIMI